MNVSEDHISYIIEGLGSDTEYSVTVTVSNEMGGVTSSPILVSTSEVYVAIGKTLHFIHVGVCMSC